MTQERWMPVPGYEDRYAVSDRGNVKALEREFVTRHNRVRRRRERMVNQFVNQAGIARFNASCDGKVQQLQVPDIMLEAFVRPRDNSGRVTEMVSFKNGDRSDMRLENLEWAPRPGYKKKAKTCQRGHEFFPENIEQWALKRGLNRCLSCARGRQAAYANGRSGDRGYISKVADREYLKILEERDGK